MLLLLGCVAIACARPVWALGTGKPLGAYGQQSWQSDTGLPQSTVRAIVQTRDGYLWVGTEAGLARYDGVEFRVFDSGNTPGLASDSISGLSEDRDGALWIGTAQGVACYREGAFTFYGTSDGLPSATVLGTYRTRDGGVLVMTPAGAAAFRGRRWQALPGTERLGMTAEVSLVAEDGRGRMWMAGPAGAAAVVREGAGGAVAGLELVGSIEALAVDAEGALWVGGAGGLLRVGEDGRGASQIGAARQASAGGAARGRGGARDGLPAAEVTSLLAAPGGGMWIGTAKGLALASAGGIRALPEFRGQRVLRLFLDRAGTLWVATSEGLARVTGGAVDFATRKPVPTGVLSILEDREGSMWFGTETAGLHLVREQAFSTLTSDDGLSASLVRAVFEDHAGTLWMGTSGGGLDLLRDGRVQPFAGRLPSKVVLALAETSGAGGYELWVGTPEGLVGVRGSETRLFTTADGLIDDFVRSLYADRDGSLWVGTRHGLSHYAGGSFRSYSRVDGLAGDLIGAILRTSGGALYVGTLGGLSRMKGDGFEDALPGAPGGVAVTALLEDSPGTLWMGSNGGGVSSLARGRLTRYPPAETGLPATVYGMLEDGGGHLWLSSRRGVDRVGLAALEAFAGGRAGGLGVVHYGTADGMRINEASGGGHPAACRARDGGLWFATLNGAAVVHPGAGLRNAVPPLTAIEQVLVEDRPEPAGDGPAAATITVPPGHGRLTVQYTGLSFVAPLKVRYRYRLEGLDKGWVEAGSRRTAFYTNVPPGTYRFLVLSANNDGVWSTAPAEVRFHVQPYLYQTGWFYALMTVALLGLGYALYRWRLLLVQAQYQAVLQERGRIAREIHDTLAQGYVAISVQLELAERLLASSAEAAREQLRETRTLVRESLAEARSSIWNLRAQSDAETLPSRLAAYCTAQGAALARRDGAGATLKFDVHGTYRPLALRVEEEVQRIAQEAVLNAVAHARATRIMVTLSYDTQVLELCVTDDGVGLQPMAVEPTSRGRFGLQGMRERAQRIGAVLAFEGGQPRGTTVRLEVALRRGNARREAT
ncbi:MAG TPA: two-component regulator propeller domain-containing protein [Acidobacteriaceae bacterium]